MTSKNHKEIAKDFLRLAASVHVREAYKKYVGPNFLHHNPFFKGDAPSLMIAMEENAKQFPNKALEILRVVEENDLVVLHSRVHLKPGDRGMALVHIFKFEGDLIAELWDVGQPVPENSPNEVGMF